MLNQLKSTLGLALLLLLGATAASAISVRVKPSVLSPAPVGTSVVFSASVSGAGNNLWYRFRVRKQGGDYQMVRDFGPSSSLAWTASNHEGAYDVQVSVRDLDSGASAQNFTLFQFNSRVVGYQPVVSPTDNALVFLFSAPACAPTEHMRVQFTDPNGVAQFTPYQACNNLSMNFYLAGMRAKTTYKALYILKTNSVTVMSDALPFTTGEVPLGVYTDTILTPAPANATNRILLGSPLAYRPTANDLSGNLLWYGPSDISMITRAQAGGNMWGVLEVAGGTPAQQIVREFDLTGMTLLETNAARINEQLKALGKRQIAAFHHEARTLPNGRVAVLANVEQILTDVQGPGPVDVVGDMIVVMDKDLNVIWTWDTFDNLDVHRMAVLGETCPHACPPTTLAATGMDWTHGNAFQQTPDGNLLYSSRHQDWLIKISYDQGNGDGHVIWRLGKDGDFAINSKDPYPWFSHQHDANFETADPTKLLVFDNGNTRVAMNGGNSRGQELQIDEKNMVATPLLNVDLGVYSSAVGSAQKLRDGNFHFDAGFVQENKTLDSYSFEIAPAGKVVYKASQNAILYRTFRMTDMYTPN